MVRDQLLGLVNHTVKIAPFPHGWNDFRVISVDNKLVVLYKLSNSQRFDLEITHISRISEPHAGERSAIVINRRVHFDPDRTGYGNIWKIRSRRRISQRSELLSVRSLRTQFT